MRDDLECEALLIQTRALAEQAGVWRVPNEFGFVLTVTLFNGETLAPMAVVNAKRVSELIYDFRPEHVSVEVAGHEDADAVRAALGMGGDRTLH